MVLVIGNALISRFIDSLEQEHKIFLDWVHILALDEFSKIVKSRVTLVLSVNCLESNFTFNAKLVGDTLAHQFNRDFTLTELS